MGNYSKSVMQCYIWGWSIVSQFTRIQVKLSTQKGKLMFTKSNYSSVSSAGRQGALCIEAPKRRNFRSSFSYPRSMWLIPSICVVPSADNPAKTRAAPALKSVAKTGAPYSKLQLHNCECKNKEDGISSKGIWTRFQPEPKFESKVVLTVLLVVEWTSADKLVSAKFYKKGLVKDTWRSVLFQVTCQSLCHLWWQCFDSFLSGLQASAAPPLKIRMHNVLTQHPTKESKWEGCEKQKNKTIPGEVE